MIRLLMLALLLAVCTPAWGQTNTPTLTHTPTPTLTPGPESCCQCPVLPGPVYGCVAPPPTTTPGVYSCGATCLVVGNASCDADTGACVTPTRTPTPVICCACFNAFCTQVGSDEDCTALGISCTPEHNQSCQPPGTPGTLGTGSCEPLPTHTPTLTWTPTFTPSPTRTPTFTLTPTWTPTPTPSSTPTRTPTLSPRPTRTFTVSPTPTITPTRTSTPTASPGPNDCCQGLTAVLVPFCLSPPKTTTPNPYGKTERTCDICNGSPGCTYSVVPDAVCAGQVCVTPTPRICCNCGDLTCAQQSDGLCPGGCTPVPDALCLTVSTPTPTRTVTP